MKLTGWIIDDAPKVVSPDKQFTLQLRNLSLTSVEELGLTQNKFESIDLTNNQLTEISNFEVLSQVKTLLASNNKELYLVDTEKVPNLTSLSVMNCNFKLAELKNLGSLQNLHHLVLIGNPVCSIEDYRLIIIFLAPNLKTLDFQKVKKTERDESIKKYGTEKTPTPEGTALFTGGRPKISQEMKTKLIDQLQNTNDINEIERIERILQSGIL